MKEAFQEGIWRKSKGRGGLFNTFLPRKGAASEGGEFGAKSSILTQRSPSLGPRCSMIAVAKEGAGLVLGIQSHLPYSTARCVKNSSKSCYRRGAAPKIMKDLLRPGMPVSYRIGHLLLIAIR